MLDYSSLRKNMVESQVRTNDITDRRVLRAMLDLPREKFVPRDLQALAYNGEGLSLAGLAPGRSLPAPVVTARLIQLAGLDFEERVLEIGCATGYGTAVLARIAKSVTGLDNAAGLTDLAQANLAELGVRNAEIVIGSLAAGASGNAPYDVIVVSGMLPEPPPAAWREQLRDGGRLIAILADGPIGRATVFERTGDRFSRRIAFDCTAPMLPGFERKAEFIL